MLTIYVNDLLSALPSTSILVYADDVTLTIHGDTEESTTATLQSLVDSVFEWSQHNCLSLNPMKCVWLLMSPMLRPAPATTSSTSESVLTISSMPITKTSSLRLLRVQFAENLSWAAYGNAIVKKVNCMLGTIWRAGSVVNVKARLQMYEAFVRPRLLYCLPIWSNCDKTTANELDKQ